MLNGVVQIGGTASEVTAGTANFSVDANGQNIVFDSGTPPQATDVLHIIELPI